MRAARHASRPRACRRLICLWVALHRTRRDADTPGAPGGRSCLATSWHQVDLVEVGLGAGMRSRLGRISIVSHYAQNISLNSLAVGQKSAIQWLSRVRGTRPQCGAYARGRCWSRPGQHFGGQE